MQNKAYILGYGQTKCGFYPDRGISGLISEAYLNALDYSGIEPRNIQQMWLSQAPLQCDLQATAGQVAVDAVGLGSRVGCITIEQACASGGQAIHDASLAIESGRYDCVLVVGFAKMADSMRPGERPNLYPSHTGIFAEDGFNPLYSHAGVILTEPGATDEYHSAYDITAEDIASWNLNQFWYATKHPNSLCYGKTTPTKEELIAIGGGPRIAYGCDGAAAIILASRDFTKQYTDTLIYVAAAAHKSESSYYAKMLDYGYGGDTPRFVAGTVIYSHSVENAWKESFEQAKVGPKDLDVVNLPAPVLVTYSHLEGMHHPDIPHGTAPKWFTEGEAYPDGKLPACTLGAARFGEPRGALGINLLIENYMQLKEECGEWQVPIRKGVAAGCCSPGRPAFQILRREQ
ncbi:thiolase family protein [Chloroflexota bacterium]